MPGSALIASFVAFTVAIDSPGALRADFNVSKIAIERCNRLEVINPDLIVNVGLDLLVKQGKKKLLLPMLIIIGTFVANLFFDTNIMVLILIDGIIGFLFMRAAQYN